jgi:hypothetical protein
VPVVADVLKKGDDGVVGCEDGDMLVRVKGSSG